jgi:RHS repeat-associated protein
MQKIKFFEINRCNHLADLRVACRCGDPKAGGGNDVTKIVQEDAYDPWGLTFGTANEAQTPTALTNRYTFLDREKQTDLGLNWQYLINRNYDYQTGRFMSVDPEIEDGQESFTSYHYSYNNPILFSDPNGLLGEPCCGSIDWNAAGKGFVKGVVIGAVGAVAVTALVASGGTAAPLIGYGLAAYGAYETGKTGYEVVSGKEAYSGRELSNSERSEKGGEVLGGFIGGGLGAKSGLGPKIASKITEGAAPKAKIADVISGYTRHGINQAIGRNGGKGVSTKSILNAVTNQKSASATSEGNGAMKIVGNNKTSVVINKDGKVITTYSGAKGQSRGPKISETGRPEGGGPAQRKANELGYSYNPNAIK